jgi:zinc transport system ATP-binding protein
MNTGEAKTKYWRGIASARYSFIMEKSVPAVDVKDLSVTLGGHKILDNISFSVPAGSTTAIIGPNGAGKSVLVKTILRLIPKDKGKVHIFGTDHKYYRKVAPLLSYIPQHVQFDQDFPLTVRGLFSLKSSRPIGLNGVQKQHMQELLRLVGMEEFADKRLSTLSGGQLQRVLIGYSLMDHPRLLILDEPSAGIDISGHETIYALLKRIQEEEELTMILISHELDVVMQYAEQVLCLNKQLLCAGAPHQVLSNELLQQMYGTPIGHFTHGRHPRHA